MQENTPIRKKVLIVTANVTREAQVIKEDKLRGYLCLVNGLRQWYPAILVKEIEEPKN